MATTDRISLRASKDDQRLLGIVAAHLQHTRQSPYVAPSDALREAVRIAAETIAKASLDRTVTT